MTEDRISNDLEVVDGGPVQVIERAPMAEVGIEALLKLAETADKRVAALKRLRLASIRATNNHDWVDQSGNPYLQASGGQKIAPLWGIGWQILSHSKTISSDADSYIWESILRFTDPTGRIVEAIGTRSSKDDLFAKRGDTYLPMSEVDEPSIKKASVTNCVGRGISEMVGLRNITWEELAEYGITRGKTHTITRTSASAPTKEDGEHKQELWDMLLEISGGDTKAAKQLLLDTTAFTSKDGKDIPGCPMTKLGGKRLQVTIGKVRDMHKIYLSDIAQGEQDEPESNETEASDG